MRPAGALGRMTQRVLGASLSDAAAVPCVSSRSARRASIAISSRRNASFCGANWRRREQHASGLMPHSRGSRTYSTQSDTKPGAEPPSFAFAFE